MEQLEKKQLLGVLGYGDTDRCMEVIAATGLSRRGRARVSRAKVPRIEAELSTRLVRVYHRGDCRLAAGRVRREMTAARDQAACEICGGSVLNRRLDQMVAACRASGIRRVCVVGGSPSSHGQLRRLVTGHVELRLVDGAIKRPRRQTRADLAWADLVLVWGSTILDHSVSGPYMHQPNSVACHGRGIGHLVLVALTWLSGRPRGQR